MCILGEGREAPQQAGPPTPPVQDKQAERQSRESPDALTFQLCWQMYPSLNSDGNGAPQKEVEDNAHQIQPPDHLYRRGTGDKWTPTSTGRCIGLHIQNWGTHRVAKQIDSEICVVGP